jgi:hypothetical protein
MTARVTVLTPQLADAHETTGTPGCLAAPDGVTCCPQPAAYRLELPPLPTSVCGPVTFACPEHTAQLRALWPSLATIRSLKP